MEDFGMTRQGRAPASQGFTLQHANHFLKHTIACQVFVIQFNDHGPATSITNPKGIAPYGGRNAPLLPTNVNVTRLFNPLPDINCLEVNNVNSFLASSWKKREVKGSKNSFFENKKGLWRDSTKFEKNLDCWLELVIYVKKLQWCVIIGGIKWLTCLH